MPKSLSKKREEARRLFLTGEMDTNREIAVRLGVKPHTIGAWRRQEDWDGLRLKVDRRAAEMFVEKIATDRVTLNLRHFRYWELLLARMAEDLKSEAELVEAIDGLWEENEDLERMVVKQNTGFSGQGNAILDLSALSEVSPKSGATREAREQALAAQQSQLGE